MKKSLLIPLGLFLALAVFLAIGLKLDPREVPSPLVGKTIPSFRSQKLQAPNQNFTPQDMQGKVWLLNVWASWCVACQQEHPVLMRFSKTRAVPIIGLDYKDQDAAGLQWLGRHGDPYDFSVTDPLGKAGLDLGVYGVPETFVIDKSGVIRYKHIGPISDETITTKILPLVLSLQK
jgi:cytochrome c biogenesis protein CcmG, thiol:disulfide interchange protein DsbE